MRPKRGNGREFTCVWPRIAECSKWFRYPGQFFKQQRRPKYDVISQTLVDHHGGGLAGGEHRAGIHSDTSSGLLLAALALGLLNAFVRPVMVVLSLPLVIFTLGLFMLVINALLLWSVGLVLKDFHVDSFGAAFWGSLIISLTSLVLNSLTKSGSSRVEFPHRQTAAASPARRRRRPGH
jgi:putative membrane protein